ncbi:Trans-resveratrol di-O-methyltransferase [Vitis vinifera]|uniref:Trans-resveratrol di-O-methyltransferase n=1 Tax=Vitis vinifera TaxID=29760 RepID=A0A438G3R6_VITVI|nr:Trans-resveratrol di-O-methyltransferase [Vitis vinifera]
MDLGSAERADELLQAQAHVVNHVFNFMNSMALKCAIDLAIPDVIHSHGQPMLLSQLQQVIHNNEQEEGYSLTSASRFLLKDEPLTGLPLSLLHLNPVLTAPWHFLSGWFRNGDPTPFYTAHGKPYWDYTAQEPDFNDLFNEAMASDSRIIASVLITKCKEQFKGMSSLVDVGAGTGTMTKAIAKAFPHLKCMVFDQPHVVADLQGGGNLEVVGGDMFEQFLLRMQSYSSDEECVKILKKCKEAIPTKDKGGKLMIIDMVMENNKGDDQAVETQLFWDMLMMTVLTGKQRNENEWKKLFVTAGFTHYKISAVLGFRSLIEVYP